MSELWNRLERRSPATSPEVRKAEEEFGHKFPEDYLNFLNVSDGTEGFLGSSYLILWRVKELKLMNDSYDVQAFAPGFLLIGSDGGGEAYGFDTRSANWSVVSLPFVGMDWKHAKPLGKSFTDFLDRLRAGG